MWVGMKLIIQKMGGRIANLGGLCAYLGGLDWVMGWISGYTECSNFRLVNLARR